MKRFKRVIVLWLLLACLGGSALMTGCNTLGGAGEDIEQAGEGIQDAAD